MKLDKTVNQIYIVAYNEAKLQKHEYLTPEHILQAALFFNAGRNIIINSNGDADKIIEDLQNFFDSRISKVENEEPIETIGISILFNAAAAHAISTGHAEIKISDILAAIFSQEESFGVHMLRKNGVSKLALLTYLSQSNINPQKKEDRQLTTKDKEYLKSFAYDLTEQAEMGKLDPIIGRKEILTRTMQVLCRRTKNNPIHVGDPGVGKTAIVQGLAQKIATGKIPDKLKKTRIYYLDISAILAGTRYRGDFEERLKKILEILIKMENAIIYIDEIHTVVGTGAVSGSSMDASNIIKPYLTNRNLRFIGSTTYEEYKKFFEKDRALSRRFQKIEIQEPTIDDTFEILKGIKEKYENYHNVKYSDEILMLAIKLSDKYIHERFLPDKAIDIIDEAGALANIETMQKNITNKEIEKTISMIAKVPEESISSNELDKLIKLEEHLKAQIFGQDSAIEAVVNSIKRSRSGLSEPEKTVANLLFVGPTGVGKTEIAKQLAKQLNIPLLRFDMSEYQEKHSVARLIGSPPGYIGYEEGGLLTDAIKKSPHSVLLLDEIEKAHNDILNVLLQIMDYAKLTDSSGKKADFKNVIIIMTSNAGARDMEKTPIGFDKTTQNNNTSILTKEIENTFSPEFRNRLDETILFNNINEKMALSIAKKAINQLSEKLADKNITLTITDQLLKWIAEKGLSAKYGAREIIRIIEKEIKIKFVDLILFENLKPQGSITLTIENEKIQLQH